MQNQTQDSIPSGLESQEAQAWSRSGNSSSIAVVANDPRRNDWFEDIWLEHDRFAMSSDSHDGAAALRAGTTPDLHRLRTTHTTAGYRDGLAAAREAAVQSGFDEGHLLGAAVGLRSGYLQGLIEGLQHGIDFARMDGDARAIVEKHLAEMKEELQLPNLLGEQWISNEGTWKWNVASRDEEDLTIGGIANAHPVIQKVNRRVGIYSQHLGIKRAEPA